MNKMEFMKVNIRQFEGNEDFSQFVVDGELDTEGIINRYNSENEQETPPTDEVETNTDETNTEAGSENSDNLEDSTNTETNENSDELVDSLDNEKRTTDQAFADMRRQLEANEPIAKWVQELATQQGFSDPKELIAEYQKQQLAREAEEQGVPVDVYQRLHQLEEENKQQRETVAATQFNHDVEVVRQKHDLSEEQLTEVFRFMGQHGYIDESGGATIPFEHAYMLANSETLIKDAEERGRQQYLEQKQQQQRQATPNIKTHAKDKEGQGELDMSKDAIFAHLEELGIDPN